MAMNPIALLKMKERLGTFNQDHPKVRQFFHGHDAHLVFMNLRHGIFPLVDSAL